MGHDTTPHGGDDAVIGQALLVSLIVILVGGLGVGVAYLVFGASKAPVEIVDQTLELPEVRRTKGIDFPDVSFTDVTEEWGIDFVHENGAAGDKLLPETMGSGCAAFDYDSDGDVDLLFINSQEWNPQPGSSATLKMYRNDGGQFADVTQEVGLDFSLYGMGVAVGDIDNDGDSDLFISALGKNRLLVMEEGKYVDRTEAAGVAGDNMWSTSCGFVDYDNDGLLDLFVCNYLRWTAEVDASQKFRLAGGGRAYGPPSAFDGTFPYLYHNEGDGKFTDVSAEAGVQVINKAQDVPVAKSLGLSTIDIDEDGWMDILVANDTVPNFLFHNQQDGTFKEVGGQVGIAFDSDGRARGAMGIDVDFVRENGQLAIGIGNFSNEASALYVKRPKQMLFLDEATSTGFGPPTRLALTFGLFFFDFDLDGRLDIFGANGHLENEISKVQVSQTYEQEPHLFWNRGVGMRSNEFARVPKGRVGEDFSERVVGRGAVSADLDGDGDLDLVITQCGRKAKVLRNDQAIGHHWLRVRLVGGGKSNRDAVGATITMSVKGKILKRQVSRTRSYLSQSEAAVTFGLRTYDAVESIQVRWPDGTVQDVAVPAAVDQLLIVEQA